MVRAVLLVMVLAAAAGCGLREVENLRTPYVASEYLPYAQPGSARVAGGVADRAVAGHVMTCADMEVQLAPATDHTREAIGIVRAGKLPSDRALGANRTLLRSTIKKSTCDAQGNFGFDGLATGPWILVVGLRANDDDSLAGAMIREVTVAAGEKLTVTFTDDDFVPR